MSSASLPSPKIRTFATLTAGWVALVLILSARWCPAQMPPKESSQRAIAKYPDLGKEGSLFNNEFMRRWRLRSAENPSFHLDKNWPMKLADEVAEVIGNYAPKPEIEFKVLLIIKRLSDTYHPLFLPVRAEMTEEDITAARHCFEFQTPDMIHEATQGKVKFIPTVIVSSKPLRVFMSSQLDNAEVEPDEVINELAELTKPGEYDSVGCYYLHYDRTSGYRAPRKIYGLGGYNGRASAGMFAISSAGKMNPRDEIYLHEWMHGMDGFYGKKEGVRLPKGNLHGSVNYAAHYNEAKAWRPQDTFKGYMEWYKDILNCKVPEPEGGFSGYGEAAWKHGTIREAAKQLGPRFPTRELEIGTYPEWVHELMRGNLTRAELGESELALPATPCDIEANHPSWKLESYTKAPTTTAKFSPADGGSFTLECEQSDKATIVHEAKLQPRANYIFTAEVKTTLVKIEQAGGKHAVRLLAGDSETSKDLSGSVDWTPLVLPFTLTDEKSTITLRLMMGGDGSRTSGKAQFRNVRLQRVGYPAKRLIRAVQTQ